MKFLAPFLNLFLIKKKTTYAPFIAFSTDRKNGRTSPAKLFLPPMKVAIVLSKVWITSQCWQSWVGRIASSTWLFGSGFTGELQRLCPDLVLGNGRSELTDTTGLLYPVEISSSFSLRASQMRTPVVRTPTKFTFAWPIAPAVALGISKCWERIDIVKRSPEGLSLLKWKRFSSRFWDGAETVAVVTAAWSASLFRRLALCLDVLTLPVSKELLSMHLAHNGYTRTNAGTHQRVYSLSLSLFLSFSLSLTHTHSFLCLDFTEPFFFLTVKIIGPTTCYQPSPT